MILMEISRIADLLNARIGDVVHTLSLTGRREGHEFVALNPTRADRSLGSFRICLTGAKAGIWKEFASGDDGGDALDLVAYCAFGGDKRRAIEWARGFLGLDGHSPESLARTRHAAARHAEAEAKADEDEEQKRRNIKAVWLAAQASLAGTPAALYLANRGIDLDLLRSPASPGVARQPRALRFHPNLFHKQSQHHYPALVAAIDGPDGLLGIHRTYLARVDGAWVKAPELGADAKMSWGRYKGGLIKIWRGVSGKPLKDAPAGEFVALSEGIEDALSVALAKPELRVCCAVSLGAMLSVRLPDQVNVMLLAQNDANGSQAQATLDRVSDRFRKEGRTVRIARPPAGIKDWNDMIRAQQTARQGEDVA